MECPTHLAMSPEQSFHHLGLPLLTGKLQPGREMQKNLWQHRVWLHSLPHW